VPERPGLGRRLLDRLRGGPELPLGETHALDLDGAIALVESRAGAEVFTDPAEALGAALCGRRVALAATLVDGDVPAALKGFLSSPVPVVAWLECEALPMPGRLPEGVVVFAPGSLQEAIDLALAARGLTEDALCPVVLLVPRWDEQDVLVPEGAVFESLLGSPADPVDPPTGPQRALFGAHRRRVPAWFDPARPLAVGGAARDDLAAAQELAKHAVFHVPLGALANANCAATAEATGRALPPVVVHAAGRSKSVVVAAGALGRVGVLGARRVRPLRLHPFPSGFLSEALGTAGSVAVLQDGPETGPGSLFAAVEAACSAEVRLGWRPPAGAAGGSEDGQLAAWVGAFVDGGEPRIRLGEDAGSATGFPRRDAAVQALREAAPSLAGEAAAPADHSKAAPGSDPELPRLLRRIPAARPEPDSLPRFWGEVLQPLAANVPVAPSAVLAAHAVPGAATALQPARRGEATLPVLDPELCTGCGACWAACPDSAFAATALRLPALLDAAADVAGVSGKAAGVVRRGHKNLAARIAKSLRDAAVPDRPQWRSGWDWLAEKLSVGDERAEHDDVWRRTEDVLVDLRPFATEVLFDRAESATKGSGALLLLGVDPDACTGCGLCVKSCDPGALRQVPRDGEVVAEARAQHSVHEGLPDTSGDTLAWLEEQPEGDPVRALLLSRPLAEAQVGGGRTEPGSGARLAVRLATAFAEEAGARGQSGLLSALKDQRGGLQQRLEALLAQSTAQTNAASVAQAAAGGGRIELSRLLAGIDAAGTHPTVDADAVRRIAETAVAVDALIERFSSGPDGLGSARFAAVVSAPALEPLLRYPGHPWFAPTAVVKPSDVVPVARSLAANLVRDHLNAVRTLRRADLLVRSPGDLERRLTALDDLNWADLGVADRAACPPLLVLVGPDPGAPADASGFAPLLREDLPVRVLLVDGAEAPGEGVDPALLAVASGSAWVGATSPAFPEHFGPTLRSALRARGPSLVVLHAPSPERHGFESNHTLEVARSAVEARVAPLFRFDPSQDALHARFDLSGNPQEAATFESWLSLQPVLKARMTSAQAAQASRAVLARWQALVALAGPPPAPPAPSEPAAPPSPPLRRESVEQELHARLASNLRRLARGPAEGEA
jgi:ferredoxin